MAKPGNIHFHSYNPFFIGNTWRDYSFSRTAYEIIQKLDVDLIQSHERGLHEIINCYYQLKSEFHANFMRLTQLFNSKQGRFVSDRLDNMKY